MLSSTATGMLAIILSTQVSAALVAFALLSVFLAFSCRTIIGGNESAMNLGEMKVFSATFRERGANLSEHLACELRRTPSRNCPKRVRRVVIGYSSTYEKDIPDRPLRRRVVLHRAPSART